MSEDANLIKETVEIDMDSVTSNGVEQNVLAMTVTEPAKVSR